MVDVLEAAGEIALAPPRSPSRLGRVALLLALLPGLGLALNAASPPG